MSPIIDLQRRMAEKGRIRMGEKKPGEKFPRKLDTFRLTSADRTAIDQAAAIYGGTVEPWESPNGQQWQVVTTADRLNVIVLPGEMAFSQWLESWSGGGCQRRCDGVHDTISDGPCLCDSTSRECKETTRLSVMLPDLAGVGLWRLESHGYYAATELAGALEVISGLAPGMMVRAVLSAQKRTVKRFDKDGKPQTQRFVVPVLDLADVRLSELMAPAGDGVSVQIEARTGLTPVPVAELAAGPTPSVREQIEAVPEPKPRRANAAAVLPATGLEPPGFPHVETIPELSDTDDLWKRNNPRARALAHKAWGDDATARDAQWHETIFALTDGRTESSKQLTESEWADLLAVLETAAEVGGPGRSGEGRPSPAGAPGAAVARLTALVDGDGRKRAGAVKRANRLGGCASWDEIDEATAGLVLAEMEAQ